MIHLSFMPVVHNTKVKCLHRSIRSYVGRDLFLPFVLRDGDETGTTRQVVHNMLDVKEYNLYNVLLGRHGEL